MKKNEVFKFRLSSEDLQKIRQNAKEANMSASKYVLKSSLGPVIKIEGLKDYTEQIRKIGVNVNQMAVLCHQGKIKCVALQDTQEALSNLWKEVSKFRKDIRKLEEFNGSNQIQGQQADNSKGT